MSRTCRRRAEKGAAAVEFALVASLLITLLFGVIDFGWMINRDTLLNNAAREGAREGSLNPTSADITTAVRDALPGWSAADVANVVVTVTCRKADGSACPDVDTNAVSGDVVIVRVDFEHPWLTPVGMAFADHIDLSKTTEMRIE